MSRGIAMAETANGTYRANNGHESRIQRLETLAIDNSAAIAEQSMQIDSVGKQMVLSLNNVADKVEQLSCNVGEKISLLSNKVESLDSKINTSDTRIAVLESGKKSFDGLRRSLKKILLPALAAGGASVVTYLAQHFLK